MHDILAARDGILLLLDSAAAGDGLGRGPRESRSLQLVNLGPGHAVIASCRLGIRGARPIELELQETFLAPGVRSPVFARRLFVDGRLGGAATVGRPQPNPVEIGKPLLIEAEIYAADKQLRATCVVTVSSMTEEVLVFEVSAPAVVPTR
jgi:hypothetical protein